MSVYKLLGVSSFVYIHICNLEIDQMKSITHVPLIINYKIKINVYHFRCLCELAKQIGFTPNALDLFKLDKTLGMYRQVVSFLFFQVVCLFN